MKPLLDCRLYTFVDTAYLNGRDVASITQQLCDGGSDIIQLRAKNSSPDETRRMAEIILPMTQAAGIPLVINDHLQLAREMGAEFCHLGQEDFFDTGYTHISQLNLCRSRGDETHFDPKNRAEKNANFDQSLVTSSPTKLRIGLSTHAPVQAERAIAAGADYVAIGPIYATGTKPTAKPVTLDYVHWAAANVKIPWFAIGGINLENLDEILASGAKRICVVSAILNAPNVAEACNMFKKRLISAAQI